MKLPSDPFFVIVGVQNPMFKYLASISFEKFAVSTGLTPVLGKAMIPLFAHPAC
jgi:hypothetical protein